MANKQHDATIAATERKISIEEARKLSASNPSAIITWRPEINLPEEKQYATVRNA